MSKQLASKFHRFTLATLVACAALLLSTQLLSTQTAHASVTLEVIDFNDLQYRQVVDNEYTSSHGVTISGINVGGGPDLVVAFDTFLNRTADPDLQDPFSIGNIAQHRGRPDLMQADLPYGYDPNASRFQKALIIQERGGDYSGDGFLDDIFAPDDEGSRPAGSIFFDFDNPITAIGFDLLDIEGPDEFGADSGYVATFFAADGGELARVGFNEFLAGGAFENTGDPIIFGDHSANRILPISAAELGIEKFSRVEVNFGGSGAIDNLTYLPFAPPSPAVPEASSLIIWTLLGLAVGHKRRRSSRTAVA